VSPPPPAAAEDHETNRAPPGDLWRRHPADLARLALSVAILAALLGVAATSPDAIRDISGDLARAVRRTPAPLRLAFLGIAQIAAALGPLAAAAWLLTRRRLRLAATAGAAALIAAALMSMLQSWLDRIVPPESTEVAEVTSWLTGASFPSGAYLAGLTGAVVVLGSGSTRQWRQAGWIVVGAAALIRVAAAVSVPVNVGVTLAIGAAAGSLVLVAVGAPVRRLDSATVLQVVRRLGLPASDIEEVDVGAANSRVFVVHDGGVASAFVKVLGRDERAAELLMRTVRRLRLRGLADERPGWSPTNLVRHEALAGTLAAGRGVRVARVLAVGDTTEGDGVCAFEHLAGTPLAELAPDALDDGLLDALWASVARLRSARIAHRWLDATHILVSEDGVPHLIDFRWSSIDADDRLLSIDVADLVTSLAHLVGIERAVASASRHLPAEALADAIPLVQNLVLAPATRAASDADPALLDAVRDELARSTGVDEYELAELQRLSWARVMGWLGTAVIVYVALALATNWSNIVASFRDASWEYLPVILALTVVGTVGGALSLMGAVTRPLPFLGTVEIMYAQSFLNRFTPANAGGMALRARYLQSHGSDLTVAAASVGITSLASGALQVLFLATFALWAGRSEELAFSLPSVQAVAVVVLVILLAGALVLAVPWGRRLVFGNVLPSLSRAWAELRALAVDPTKLLYLFGGAALAKLAIIVAFVLSARSFGVDDSFARMALLYMTANTVASAAPTPGGVGAIEAALVAVLTGIGVEPAEALSIVVVFRLLTYWLPVLPSWLALRRVQAAGVV
jgi:glycosyltransferase 2 family protein